MKFRLEDIPKDKLPLKVVVVPRNASAQVKMALPDGYSFVVGRDGKFKGADGRTLSAFKWATIVTAETEEEVLQRKIKALL